MPVTFEWANEEQTLMRYVASGDDWNWKSFYHAVHKSLFKLVNVDHAVHTWADFRPAERMPRGASAHLRSIGKQREHTNLSGKCILTGVPDDLRVQVTGHPDIYTVTTATQAVHFAQDDEEAFDICRRWDDAAANPD
ncbi:MAG: hypothetical protein EA396_00895 [Anaerolineaceae bacterium]|nr:MAG: hypothetical protein EA396_00895 [Anaerolineaceae bacterium]